MRVKFHVGAVFLFLILLVAWVGISMTGAQVQLTEEEKKWIRDNPEIRVAPDPDFYPVEYFDVNGRYRGISADYLALLEKRLGVHFRIVRLKNWDEIIRKVRSGSIDMLCAATKTARREAYLLFTRDYLEIPAVIIAPKTTGKQLTLSRLKGSSVSVVSNYPSQEYIAREYPGVKLDIVPDTRTGLRRVSFGESAAYVENLLTATAYLNREGITNLRIAGEAGFFYRESFACRNNLPELNRILEKGLAAISASEKDLIYRKWVPLESQVFFLSRNVLYEILFVAGGALLVFLVILVWNRSLARQFNQRTADLRNELAERSRVEESLRMSEERFRVLAETSPSAIFVYQGEKVVYVNPAAVSLFGYSEEEWLGMDFWRIAHESCMEKVINYGMSRQRGGQAPTQYEARFITRDGDEKWALISAGLIQYNGALAGIATVIDISERKFMEDELRIAREELEHRVRERTGELSLALRSLGESEKRYRRILDTSMEGVWTMGRDFRIDFLNPRMAGMLGYGVNEILGKGIDCFLFAEDMEDHRKQLNLRKKGVGSRYERRFHAKGGRILWALVNATPLLDDEGVFCGSFAMVSDITGLKEAEESLRKAHSEMEAKVRERTEQLEGLAAEISLVEERERRRIAGELHDQVGQTLALIKIKLDMLSNSLLPGRMEECLAGMLEHMDGVIQEIRSLTFQLCPPLLYDVGLEAALEWLCEEFESRYGIIAEFRGSGGPEMENEEEAGALYRMVRELLVNVVKHANAERVTLTCGQHSGRVVIAVEDDGLGFDVARTDWKKGGKHGFGLFNILNRINHLGGECGIDSSINQGTRVTLSLPARSREISVSEGAL